MYKINTIDKEFKTFNEAMTYKCKHVRDKIRQIEECIKSNYDDLRLRYPNDDRYNESRSKVDQYLHIMMDARRECRYASTLEIDAIAKMQEPKQKRIFM